APSSDPQYWHPAFTGSGRGSVGPFGFSIVASTDPVAWSSSPGRDDCTPGRQGLASSTGHPIRPILCSPAQRPPSANCPTLAPYDSEHVTIRARLIVGEPGSAGIVQTQFAGLPDPLPLDSGRILWPVRIAYETYG